MQGLLRMRLHSRQIAESGGNKPHTGLKTRVIHQPSAEADSDSFSLEETTDV